MRILYDVLRDGLSSINQAAENLAAAQQQVSSGRRIARASDDPLGAQKATDEHAGLSALDAYSQSRDGAAARLAGADATLAAMGDKLTSVLANALAARGSSATPSSRSAVAADVRSMRDALLADFNTPFNGTYVFSGTAARTPAYAQIAGVWTYQGSADTTRLEVMDGRLVSVSFDGQAIAQGSDATDVFTVLDQLATAIDAGDEAGMAAATAGLERAYDRTLRAQGRLGADERSLDDAALRLTAMRTAGESRRAALEDANMVEAMTRLSTADTAYRAALAAVSMAERTSLLDYLQ